MELQIALDRITLDQAVAIAATVAPQADWIEVGTSLIKHYGTASITEVIRAAPGVPVLADMKTADDAAYEFTLAYDAGASSATVLGLADDSTITTAVRVATERQREAMIDLMSTTSARRADLAARLPASAVFAAHVPKDAQGPQAAPGQLLGTWALGRHIALAGGLGAHEIAQLTPTPNLRVVVGSAITAAADPAAAAQQVRAAIEHTENT